MGVWQCAVCATAQATGSAAAPAQEYWPPVPCGELQLPACQTGDGMELKEILKFWEPCRCLVRMGFCKHV